MAGRRKPEHEKFTATKLSIALPTDLRNAIEDMVGKDVGGIRRHSAAEIIRDLTRDGLRRITAEPSQEARALPVLADVPCGTVCDLDTVLKADDIETMVIRDPHILSLATEHAFIAKASGWSMRNEQLPDSISHDDDLLMIPFDEWKEGLRPGIIVLVHLLMNDGTDKCILKKWDGKELKAANPTFKKVDYFGHGVEGAVALAVCRARLPKIF